MTVFYLATGKSFMRLDPDRDAWQVHRSLEGYSVQCLAVDPIEGKTIYAGTFREGLWKSSDGGNSWQDCHLPEKAVFSIAVSPADRAIYTGTEPSALYKSVDAGQSWQELESLNSIPSAPSWSFPPRPHTSHVRWIAPHPEQADLILVGIELGGVMRTTDGGRSWQDHRPGAEKDAHELAWHPERSQRAYQAAGSGSTWSDDYGETWQPLSEGKDHHYTWALAVDPANPSLWYCSAAPGAYAAHYYEDQADAFVYRRKDNGPWLPLTTLAKSKSIMPYSMQVLEGNLYVGFRDGEIWSSPDEGESWVAIPIGTPAPEGIIQLVAV